MATVICSVPVYLSANISNLIYSVTKGRCGALCYKLTPRLRQRGGQPQEVAEAIVWLFFPYSE
jgi:hypothetical protein